MEGNRSPKWWILKTIISGTLELLLCLRGIPSCISFSSCKAALPWSPRVVFHAPRVARMCFRKCFALTLLERLVEALLELQDWILRSIMYWTRDLLGLPGVILACISFLSCKATLPKSSRESSMFQMLAGLVFRSVFPCLGWFSVLLLPPARLLGLGLHFFVTQIGR